MEPRALLSIWPDCGYVTQDDCMRKCNVGKQTKQKDYAQKKIKKSDTHLKLDTKFTFKNPLLVISSFKIEKCTKQLW